MTASGAKSASTRPICRIASRSQICSMAVLGSTCANFGVTDLFLGSASAEAESICVARRQGRGLGASGEAAGPRRGMDDRVKLLWSYGFDLNGALRSRGVDV